MVDPVEPLLQRTRQRARANSMYEFDFRGVGERAVFPIIHHAADGVMRLIGTGFFIAAGGIFLTAKHVFEGPDISNTDHFDALQVCENQIAQRLITHLHSHPEFDLVVGRLAPSEIDCPSCDEHPVVSVMSLDPIVSEQGNEVVASYVFAHTLVHDQDDEPLTRLITHRGHWEKGHVEEIFPAGDGRVTGPCFSSSIFTEGRASGAPVFNSNGFVIGINSRGFAEVDGLPYSTASSIRGALAMRVDGRTIAEHREGLQNRPTVSVRRNRTPN